MRPNNPYIRFVLVERVEGALVLQSGWWHNGVLRCDFADVASNVPVIGAAYSGGIEIECEGRDLGRPYWFLVPDDPEGWLRPPPGQEAFNVRRIPAYLIIHGGFFMCGVHDSGVDDGWADAARYVAPFLITDTGTMNVWVMEALHYVWAYEPNGRNDLLLYWSARRVHVAGRDDPRFLKFLTNFACYAYTSGSFKIAYLAFFFVRSRLERGKRRWLPLSDNPKDPVDGFAVYSDTPRYLWWLVVTKIWLLETNVMLIRCDRTGVKTALRRFLSLVRENVPYIRPYHIVWALQEVYAVVFPFRPHADPEVDQLIQDMETMWGQSLRMLYGLPWGRPGSGPECTTSRDDRVACNKLVGGRATPEDLRDVQQSLNRLMSRQNKLVNHVALAYYTQTDDLLLLEAFSAVALEAKTYMYAWPLVLIFSLLQCRYHVSLVAAWDAESTNAPATPPSVAPVGPAVQAALETLLSEIIRWCLYKDDAVLRYAIENSYLWQDDQNRLRRLVPR